MRRVLSVFFVIGVLCMIGVAFSEGQPVQAAEVADATVHASKIDTGDTAWILVSTALVMLITPGLALFYGGMSR